MRLFCGGRGRGRGGGYHARTVKLRIVGGRWSREEMGRVVRACEGLRELRVECVDRFDPRVLESKELESEFESDSGGAGSCIL